jgi:endonuclease G
MLDFSGSKRETRYGVPAADLILYNRYYVLGYSYYFRQAKWALEIVDQSMEPLGRADNFRPDYRIPDMFRADLADYEGSGYDRGHLVPSADKTELELQNSETFLLSNMSPQKPRFNRGAWKKLEGAVRQLDAKKNIYETYVISGPIFDFRAKVKLIGSQDENGVTLPVPDAYFKSVLTENNRGALHMWSFMMDNEESDKPLEDFLVPTVKVEQYAGIFLWERLVGRKIEREKSKIRKMWKYD